MKRQVWIFVVAMLIAVFGGHVGIAHATDPTTGDPGDRGGRRHGLRARGLRTSTAAPASSSTAARRSRAPRWRRTRRSTCCSAWATTSTAAAIRRSTPLSYTPTWGCLQHIIDPSVGNHEYDTDELRERHTVPGRQPVGERLLQLLRRSRAPGHGRRVFVQRRQVAPDLAERELQEQRRRRLRRLRRPDRVADGRPRREHAAVRRWRTGTSRGGRRRPRTPRRTPRGGTSSTRTTSTWC